MGERVTTDDEITAAAFATSPAWPNLRTPRTNPAPQKSEGHIVIVNKRLWDRQFLPELVSRYPSFKMPRVAREPIEHDTSVYILVAGQPAIKAAHELVVFMGNLPDSGYN